MSDAEDNFAACLTFTLGQECPFPNDWSNARNYSDDAHDPGGETMCGITQREYDAFRKSQGAPTREVRGITRDEGEKIYRSAYWLPHCAELLRGLDLCLFDTSVNEGAHAALVILQDALGVKPDGIWGAITANAAKNANANAVQRFTICRHAAYARLVARRPALARFEKNWLRRTELCGHTALLMAQDTITGTVRSATPASAVEVSKPAAAPEVAAARPFVAAKTATDEVHRLLADLVKLTKENL